MYTYHVKSSLVVLLFFAAHISRPGLRPAHRPMSDHFAIVPRAFSDRFFGAISAFHACDGQSWPPSVSWWQPGCGMGFEEISLFRHLHAEGVPYRFYFMFEYVITRAGRGGECHKGRVAFEEACGMLAYVGELRPPITG